MKLLEAVIFFSTMYIVWAVFKKLNSQDWRPRRRTQKPPSGIPNCLIPPFENLVYQYEGPVVGRPEMRTGCYVQNDIEGTLFPTFPIFPLRTAKPLEYYVIDSVGRKHSTTETTPLKLEVTTLGQTEIRNFTFNQLCFPTPCYSSAIIHERACYHPFPSCNSNLNICDDDNLGQIQRELSLVKNLGRASKEYEKWLYCKSLEDSQLTVPIMSPKYPFGLLQNLSRISPYKKSAGPRVVLKIEHYGPIGTVPCGCDVVFPLEPPFSSYMHRFWFLNRDTGETTIKTGETGVAERFKNLYDCLEWQSIDGKRTCVREGRLNENFTFDDFCFPQECYLEPHPPCTGKSGTYRRQIKSYSVTYRANSKAIGILRHIRRNEAL